VNFRKACAKNPRSPPQALLHRHSFIGNSTSPAVGTVFAYLHYKFGERQFLAGTALEIAAGFVFFCPSRPKTDIISPRAVAKILYKRPLVKESSAWH
jgi:hypothetical protein